MTERLPNCYRCDCQPCECADGITLYHADCRDVLPLLPKVDLVLTDPPYGETSLDWGSRWIAAGSPVFTTHHPPPTNHYL